MEAREFIRITLLTIAVTTVLILLSTLVPQLYIHLYYSFGLLGMFSLLSVAVFFFGKILASSENKYLYNNLIVINFISKMIFSLIAVVIYVKLFQPANDFHLIPFVVIYLIFTIYEVYFMTRQAKTKR